MTEYEPSNIRDQVADQCRVIVALANELALLYEDLGKTYASGHTDRILNLAGERTAQIMEDLGNILNGMDAIPDGIEWADAIFKRAQELWPHD